ncbi:MAG: hypothetical protein N3D10_04235 [Candidatus Micrarchaeota archaeon]|nr:hypothetical protein [Candidatus Micrarchaeota archaeon]
MLLKKEEKEEEGKKLYFKVEAGDTATGIVEKYCRAKGLNLSNHDLENIATNTIIWGGVYIIREDGKKEKLNFENARTLREGDTLDVNEAILLKAINNRVTKLGKVRNEFLNNSKEEEKIVTDQANQPVQQPTKIYFRAANSSNQVSASFLDGIVTRLNWATDNKIINPKHSWVVCCDLESLASIDPTTLKEGEKILFIPSDFLLYLQQLYDYNQLENFKNYIDQSNNTEEQDSSNKTYNQTLEKILEKTKSSLDKLKKNLETIKEEFNKNYADKSYIVFFYDPLKNYNDFYDFLGDLYKFIDKK